MNKQINNKDGQLEALPIAKQQNKIALNYNLKLKKYPCIDIDMGSGWGTHVYLWRIHFNIWQNQYNIVKFKNKKKFKNLKNKKNKKA